MQGAICICHDIHKLKDKVVSILLPIFWRQQIGWSYHAANRTFGLMA